VQPATVHDVFAGLRFAAEGAEGRRVPYPFLNAL
jgi:hypothetical protein